jgi:hypothetical protein
MTHTRKMTTRDWLVPALFVVATVYAAFNISGCSTLGGPDIEQKLIAAASKCIADASNILAAQREASVVDSAAAEMVRLQREANAHQCDAPAAADPAKAMPLQSRKP